MTNYPIFIHALFKTGSTYLWSKFRQFHQFHCYYEPFHHFLLQINHDYELKFNKKETPIGNIVSLEKHYLYEYEKLLEKGRNGMPYFNKPFIFDKYCDDQNNSDVKKYIDYLLGGASNKRPVLQFNRSSLRIRWFKKTYPDALHMYLVRDPRDQWESYNKKTKKNYRILAVMDLMIASLNLRSDFFKKLSKTIPLVEFHHHDFQHEYMFYDSISNAYNDEERYYIFYYIWLLSFIENVLNADLIVNINLLSYNNAYRQRIIEFLACYGIQNITFDDAQVKEYKEHFIDIDQMENIEKHIQKTLFESLPEDQLRSFFENISTYDRDFFKLGKEHLSVLQAKDGRFGDHTAELEKYRQIIYLLFNNYLCSQEQNTQKVRSIYNSYTFRAGKVLTYPFKILVKIFKP